MNFIRFVTTSYSTCHVNKIERQSFQNLVPITAGLRVIFGKHRVFTGLHLKRYDT